MKIPAWLTHLVYKCLEKEPGKRFENGDTLNSYMHAQGDVAGMSGTIGANESVLAEEVERLRREKNALQQQLEEANEKVDFRNYKAEGSSLFRRESKKGRLKTNIVAGLMLLSTAALLFYFIYYRQPENNLPIQKTETKKQDKNEAALSEARDHLLNSRVAAALVIYKDLADKGVPEASFQYGNLALQGLNTSIDCSQAVGYVSNAAKENYAPAKRTLGFLYAFADDEDALKKQGYENCGYTRNVKEGAELLMEAQLSGDNDAGKLLDELNAKILSGAWK